MAVWLSANNTPLVSVDLIGGNNRLECHTVLQTLSYNKYIDEVQHGHVATPVDDQER